MCGNEYVDVKLQRVGISLHFTFPVQFLAERFSVFSHLPPSSLNAPNCSTANERRGIANFCVMFTCVLFFVCLGVAFCCQFLCRDSKNGRVCESADARNHDRDTYE